MGKCIDHFFSVESKRNLIYTSISFLVLGTSITAICLMSKYGSPDEVRNFRTNAKTVLIQSSLFILLLISITISYINVLAIRNKCCSRTYISDLTEVELQLRNTAENRGRAFDFLSVVCYLCSIIDLLIS